MERVRSPGAKRNAYVISSHTCPSRAAIGLGDVCEKVQGCISVVEENALLTLSSSVKPIRCSYVGNSQSISMPLKLYSLSISIACFTNLGRIIKQDEISRTEPTFVFFVDYPLLVCTF